MAIVLLGALVSEAPAGSSHKEVPHLKRDKSFSGDGRTIFHTCIREETVPCYEWGSAVTTDEEGRIVATWAVGSDDGSVDLVNVARVLPGGELDTSFSDDGIAVFPGSSRSVVADDHSRVLFDADGLRRLNSDGTPDSGFGDDGVAAGPSGEVALDSSGRIVVAGDPVGRYGFSAHRYLEDGTLDQTFDDSATVLAGFSADGSGTVQAVAIGGDGSIFAAGSIQGSDFHERGVIAKFKPYGGLDKSFSHDGKLVTRGGGFSSIAIDGSGRVIAAGGRIKRYLPNGKLDSSFGRNRRPYGGETIALDSRGRIAAVNGVEVQLIGRAGKLLGRSSTDVPGEIPETPLGVTFATQGQIVASGFARAADVDVTRYLAN